jgi:sigma-B regulation protein RsbU (phosphoserine phosphatase)
MALSIRLKLLLSICPPMLAAMGGILAWDFQRDRTVAIEQQTSLLTARAQEVAAQIDARLEAIMAGTESGAASLGRVVTAPSPVAAMREQQFERQLAAQSRLSQYVHAALWIVERPGESPIGMFTRRGTVAPSPLADLLSKNAGALPEWYAQTRTAERGRWTDTFKFGDADDSELFAYVVPVLDAGVFRGVVATVIRADSVAAMLTGAPPPPVRRGGGVDSNRPGKNPRSGRPIEQRIRERLGRTDAPSEPPSAEPKLAAAPVPQTDPSDAARKPQTWSLVSGFGPDGFAVVDRTLSPIVSSRPESDRTVAPLQSPGAKRDVESELLSSLPGVTVMRGSDVEALSLSGDELHWVAHAPIAATGWIYVTAVPQIVVLKPVTDELQRRAVVLLGSLVIVSGFVVLLSIRLSRPVETLAHGITRLASGDLSARVGAVGGARELDQLAHGFDEMAARLQANMSELARQTGEREAIESELRVARQIQSELLPRRFPPFPERTQFGLHAVNVPARRVAGDFYDYFFCGDLLTVVIADVSGKGVPASLLMAVSRTLVRILARSGLEPEEIVRRCNAILVEDASDGMFVTMFLMQYDPATGEVVYANAGHPHPFTVGSSGRVSRFGETTAPLVGVALEEEIGQITQLSLTLEPGSSIVMYTDGVTEAHGADGKLFGEKRLISFLQSQGPKPAQELCDAIVSELDRYEGRQHGDDVTAVVLRRNS